VAEVQRQRQGSAAQRHPAQAQQKIAAVREERAEVQPGLPQAEARAAVALHPRLEQVAQLLMHQPATRFQRQAAQVAPVLRGDHSAAIPAIMAPNGLRLMAQALVEAAETVHPQRLQ